MQLAAIIMHIQFSKCLLKTFFVTLFFKSFTVPNLQCVCTEVISELCYPFIAPHYILLHILIPIVLKLTL